MPSATRRRRIEESDDEDAGPSQQQRRTQATRTLTEAVTSSSSGPSGSASAAGIDLAGELRPQPLTRAQVPNIRQLMADLKTQDQSILRCIELLHDTSEQLAESFRHEEECQELLQADADLRELIDAQAEKAIRRRVLEEISQDLQANVHVEDPAKKYKDEVRDRLDAYNKQTSRKKYAKNTDYENFRNTLWVAKEEGPMPTMKDLIPAEDGDENDEEDDDFTMGGETQNFRCPLTANVLEDPLTNTLCTHSYSRAAIEEYVRSGNNRCPAASCVAQVSERSLKQDPGLIKKVAAFKRREEEKLIARRQNSTVLY